MSLARIRWGAFAMCSAVMVLPTVLGLPASARCDAVRNGDFENRLAGWAVVPQNTQAGQASASSDAQAVDGRVFGPPLMGQAAALTVLSHALGGGSGVNEASASIVISAQAVASNRFLVFDGFGSWEMLRSGGGTGSYELRAEVEDGEGDIASRTLAIFNSPPPLACGLGMSILGIITSNGPFALDVLFGGDGQQPTGINLGDAVTLRLRLECSAGAVTGSCDEAEMAIFMFVDGVRFCSLPIGCPDFTDDDQVDVDDLIAVILAWGACPAEPEPCPADTDVDGMIDVDDLVAVITHWGPCGER
jgi:hypothetical protein